MEKFKKSTIAKLGSWLLAVAMVVTSITVPSVAVKAETASIITNGDFETGDTTGWTFGGDITPSVKTDEWATNNTTQFLNYYSAGDADLEMSQTVSLEAGTYQLKFDSEGENAPSGLTAYVKDGATELVSKAIGATTGWDNWTTITTDEFTLSETKDVTVVFSGTNAAGNWGDLDNIEIVKIQTELTEIAIENGDFEDDTTGWDLTGFSAVNEYNGSKALKLWISDTEATEVSAKYSVKLTAGTYRFDYDLCEGTAELNYIVKDEAGTALTSVSSNTATGWINGTTSQTYSTDEFTLTETKKVTFEYYGNLPAGAWGNIDNLKLFGTGAIDNTTEAVEADITVPVVEDLSEDFIRGVDISSIISLEESGVKFYDADDNEQDIFVTFKEAGANYIRVRVWNDPYNSELGVGYGGGNNDVDTAVAIAERAKDAGLSLLVDFHYSDFWADPGKQKTPKAWADLDIDAKAAKVKEFTLDALTQIGATGVNIGMVQVGNETTQKICGESSWTNMAKIYNAGSEAVREYSEDTLVAVHFTNPEKTSAIKGLADSLSANSVDYDVFGTSYYPYWHGSLSNLTTVLNYVADTYDKYTMVAETSWANTLDDTDGHENTVRVGNNDTGDNNNWDFTVEGQANEVRDVIEAVSKVNDGKGIGVFYWEGAWITVGDTTGLEGSEYTAKVTANKNLWETKGSGWAASAASEYDADDAGRWYGGSAVDNQAFFDAAGRPFESINVFKYVYTGSINKKNYVKSIDAKNTLSGTVYAGVSDNTLPTTVEVIYSIAGKKVTENETVTWNTDDLEAIDYDTPGVYTINGEVTFSHDIEFGDYKDATTAEVEYVLEVKLENLLDNDYAGFEAGSGYATEVGSVTSDDPYEGSKAFHWYSTSAATATAHLTNSVALEPGTYTLEAVAQGASSAAYLQVLDADEEIIAESDSVELEGWKVWKTPSVTFTLDDETDITVKLLVDFEAEGWGTADCLYLHVGEEETDPTPIEPPVATPAPVVKPTEAPAATPAPVGTTEEVGGAKFEVTVSESGNAEVTYVAAATTDKKVTVPDTIVVDGVTYAVTKVDDNAFKKNAKVTSVTLGSNITEIGANAFANCKNLKTVKLDAELTVIGKNAFSGCTSLKSVTIPQNVTEIGTNAFGNAKNLKKIVIKSTSLKKIGKKAFKGINPKATIKVPAKKLKAYKKLLKGKVPSTVKIKK